MKLFVNDKAFYKTLIAIAVPIALQNLINVLVSMMDTLMIGQLGETQLSATSIANQLWFILMIFCFGVAGGANVLIAQYWGKGDIEVIKRVQSITFKMGFVVSIFFGCVALFLPEQFMSIFTTEREVIEYGVQYLRIIGYSYPFYAMANIAVMMLRSIGTVNISVWVYLTSLVVNTSLNYVLIFGKFGAPALGVRGGAIATVCARVAELAIALVYILYKEKKIQFRLHDLLKSNKGLYKKYISISIPVMGNEMMWGIGASMVAVVIGRMGTNFVAAYSIFTVLNQMVCVVIFGVGNAALTIVGNSIGAGEYELAKQRSITLLVLSVLIGVGAGVVTLVLSPLIVSMYKLSPQTVEIALSINCVGALIAFFQSLAVVSMIGILRAGGDAKFVLVCETVFLWGIAVPLGFYTGLVLGWPAWIVFLALKCDEILKVIISVWRICGFKWLRDITVRD
ncbi:MATE family efflux transporter [Oscillospiraceae bacterium PP1C4]